MKTSVIVRFVVLGLLWLGLVGYLVTHVKMTLYIAFVIVASAIIVFVPMYKNIFANDGGRKQESS